MKSQRERGGPSKDIHDWAPKGDAPGLSVIILAISLAAPSLAFNERNMRKREGERELASEVRGKGIGNIEGDAGCF